MPLQSSGAISLDNIQTEFGGSNPIGIDEYYGKGGVQSSGTISIGDFYGRAAGATLTLTSSATFTVSGAGTQGNPYVATSTNKSPNTTGFAEFTLSGGNSNVTINWSVSSESNFDFLRIFRNGGSPFVQSSGVFSDVQVVSCTSGDVIRVQYSKDGSVDSFSDQASVSIFSGGTLPVPQFVPYISGNRNPVYGGGAGEYPPSGWTGIQNSSVDDDFVTVPVSFSFNFNGTSYNTLYVGSNAYITFGAGSTLYGGLSASIPGLNKIMIGASDNSYQRVSYISNSSYTRVRFEGSASTGGVVGSPNLVYEFTIWNPSIRSSRTVMEILVGAHGRTSASVWGVYSTSASISSPQGTLGANKSYIIEAQDANATSFKTISDVYSNSAY